MLREGRRLQELGLPISAFCGGGWYTDADVAAAVAELGLVDCTARAARPSYLPADARWAELDGPATVGVGSRELRCVPTTHTIGGAVRAVLSPAGLRREVVHVYFHDTDLLDWRRRNALRAALMLLGRRRRPAQLDEVAAAAGEGRSLGWEDIARGTGGLR